MKSQASILITLATIVLFFAFLFLYSLSNLSLGAYCYSLGYDDYANGFPFSDQSYCIKETNGRDYLVSVKHVEAR